MSREPSRERYEHRFGQSPPLTLGVEEELLLVDEDRQLAPVSERVLDTVSGPAAEQLSSEIFAAQIELKTGVCHSADDALQQLREARKEIAEAGFHLLGPGLHPTDCSPRAELVDRPRYEVVRKDFGDLLRTPPCGCTSTSASPTPIPLCASPTPSASTCRCCRR